MSLLQITLHWCCGFSQQCWNTSKHPGGPKMLCQIKLNQWIPLQDPPHFQTDPGPVRSALPAQSQKHAQDDRGYGNKPSLTHSGFNNNNNNKKKMNESLVSIQINSKVNMLPNMKTLINLSLYSWGILNSIRNLPRFDSGKHAVSVVYIKL